MSETHDGALARVVFAGLVPSPEGRHSSTKLTVNRGLMATMPLVLAGAMTVTMGVVAPVDSAAAAEKRPAKSKSELAKSLRELLTTVRAGSAVQATVAAAAKTTAAKATVTPNSYTVTAGDTISSIAARYRLSTASVLALNGLSWKSLIFPGQILKLTTPASTGQAPAPVLATARVATHYTIAKGDTISRVAARFGVSTQALLSANGLGWASLIYPGQTISIPAGQGSPSSYTPRVAQSLAAQPVSSVTPLPAASVGVSYAIRTGDTISSIAAHFGVAVSALLAANSLSASSMIYAGRTLLIPNQSGPQTGSSTVPLTDEMGANARIIIRVGRQFGVPDRGIVIALAAAMQESGLRDLDYGDRDSIGIFQQRPSSGWGTRAQLLNVEHSARLFYGGPSNPNAGNTRGLLEIPDWQTMTLTQAAQAVQKSAHPDAYAKWESSAWSWLAQYR